MVDSKDLQQLAPPLDTGRIVLVIVYLVAIIVAAYFLTKFLQKRSLRQGMKEEPHRSKQSAFSQFGQRKQGPAHLVSVVDRIVVDRDKTLMVVEFEGKYYLIGTTGDGFEKIDSVDIPAQTEEVEQEEQMGESAQPEDESTFQDRFKKAFGIVLRSYLPKSVREKKEMSFDAQLQARMKADNDKAKKKSG